MKQLNLLKTLFLLCALMVGSSSVWAAEATDTYIFTSKSWTATLNDVAANWTSGKDGAGFSNNGVQVTNNALYTGANATSPISYSNISKIVVTYNTNKSGGEGTFDVKIGENEAVSKDWAYSSGDGRTANYTIQYDYSPAQSGYVKITANTTTNSIYVVSVAITYEADARTPIAKIGDLSPMEIAEGAEGAFTVGITDAAGTYSVSYTSSDDNILMIDNGDYLAIAKGNVTVTVTVTPDDAETYKPVSKAFAVEVYDPDEKGTKWNPFTVAEAIDFIDAGVGLSNTYYVKGIIYSVESYSSGAISYWISDDGTTDAFECYKGKNINGANFTSVTDLSQGDIVVVKGVMKLYNSSIYEFNANNEIVSRKPAVKYVTSAGYATYVATDNMEFAEGDAFAVVIDGSVAKLTGVTKVKANTPVLLKGEGYKNVTLLDETPAAITTDLKVSNGGDPGDNAYVLANKSKGVGFYLWKSGTSLTSGKVYLQADATAHELEFIGFDEENSETTGISEIEKLRNGGNETFFNLAGQRVAQPTKGLYIVNGKKVVIK